MPVHADEVVVAVAPVQLVRAPTAAQPVVAVAALQQIVAGLSEGVILVEPDQTIAYANAAALAGWLAMACRVRISSWRRCGSCSRAATWRACVANWAGRATVAASASTCAGRPAW